MSPKFDEKALAQEIVEEATRIYKNKLLNGRDCCIGIVQVGDYLSSVVEYLREYCKNFDLKICLTSLLPETGRNAIRSKLCELNKNSCVVGILLLVRAFLTSI